MPVVEEFCEICGVPRHYEACDKGCEIFYDLKSKFNKTRVALGLCEKWAGCKLGVGLSAIELRNHLQQVLKEVGEEG